jgi:tetratricopeptide (TPR) repeat protein
MRNKKRWFWASGVIAVTVILLGNRFQWFTNSGGKNDLTKSIADFQSAVSIGKKRELKRAQGIVGQSIGDIPKMRANQSGSNSPDQQAAFPEACQSRFEKIASVALSDLINEIKVGGIAPDKLCEKNENSQLERRNIKVNMEECFAVFSKIEETETEDFGSATGRINPRIQECETALMYLRASIIDQLFPDSERESLSPQVLANKILLRLGSALASEEERKRVLGLAEELAKKEPNLYASHKAVAVLHLFEPGSDGKINPMNPKFLAAIAVCKEFGVNDPELDEVPFLALAAANRGDGVAAIARLILAENPKSAIANYYLAYDFFKKGNREEAVRILTLAHSYAPNDERIRTTLEKAHSAKLTDKIFSSQMSLSFGDGTL